MNGNHQRLNLMIVIASTRPGRVGKPVGDWFTAVAREHPGFEVTVADLAAIDLPMMNEPNHPRLRQYTHEHTKRWSALVDAQDAFVVVMPEYNHSMVAPLKNALDYLLQEWGTKPVGIVSYGGVSGGLRAAQQFKQTAVCLRMMPIPEAVTLPSIGERINEEGAFVPYDSVSRSATTMLAALWRWAVALRALRNGEVPAAPPDREPVTVRR